MTQDKYEKYLAIFYTLIVACGFVCTITTVIVWSHWRYVLDTCVNEVSCGCILNGVSTITYFTGGHSAYCYWASFGLILSILFAVVFGCYHVYRVCIRSSSSRSHTVKQRSGEVIILTTRSEVTDNNVSPYWWIPATIASGFMVLYTLVHAAMYLDGFLKSCRQYRNELIKFTQATGPMVAAVQGRITCASVFDFMDYLHPNVNFEIRRIDRINTAACLILALITAFATVVLWIGVFVINAIQSKRSRNVRI